jgi:signal transduction histidine kinase
MDVAGSSGREDPVSARFLTRLCLWGALIGVLGTLARHLVDPQFVLPLPLFFSLMYVGFAGLARAGWVQTAGVLTVMWTTAAALSVGIIHHELEQSITYTALALFVGCTVLPLRAAIVTGVGSNLLVLLAAMCPEAPSNPRFYAFVGTVMPGMTVLMLITVHHRGRRERDRRAQLEANERNLQARNRDLAFQRASLLRLTMPETPALADPMRELLQGASELLEARWIGLLMLDGDGGRYRIAHAHPEQGLSLELDPRAMPALARSWSERRLVTVGAAADGEDGETAALRAALLAPLGLHRALFAPVHIDGAAVALLCIGEAPERARAEELLGLEEQVASLTALVSAFLGAERRYQTERALTQAQKHEELAVLMGGLAHDVNNVLSVIVAQAELLRRQPGEMARTLAGADRIRAAALRAGGIVTNLLSFARPRGDLVEVVDVGALLATFADFLQPLVREDVELVMASAAASAMVRIDRHQLEQIVINLATNARQAMPSGGRLELCLDNVHYGDDQRDRPTPDAGDFVRITVRDTGVGIPPEVLRHIWDPFFTTKRTGTGLGLATVQRIVQHARGHIAVESEVGQGTTFSVYLPIAAAGPVAAAGETSAPHRIAGDHTVLIAEDDAVLRQLLEASFLELGVRVLMAQDGEQAIEAFDRHGAEISAVLLDVVMPRIGGADALRQMRRQRRDVRAILMSGYVPDAALEEIGNVSFLKKPFTLAALSQTLTEVLGVRAA